MAEVAGPAMEGTVVAVASAVASAVAFAVASAAAVPSGSVALEVAT